MPSNVDMMRQIFTLLEQNVFFGDRLTTGQFVALISPGQFISTKLKPNSLNDQHTLWKLANSTMAASFVWKPTMSTISQLYSEILSFRALPKLPLDPKQKALLASLQKDVKAWSASYEKYEIVWQDADIALSKAEASGASEPELVQLRRARDRALRQWQQDGHKFEYEKARGDIWDLVASDPAMMWQDFVNQFESFRRDAPVGRFLETVINPHPSAWESSGWTKLTLFTKDVYEHEYSKSTHFDAGVSASWGLWSFGGSYSKDTAYKHKNGQTTEMRIELEYLTVSITRPWLTQDILDRGFWCWKKGVHDNLLLSDGGNVLSNPPTPPVGAMPLLPTHWFIVRNVQLTGAWTAEDLKTYHETVSGSVGGGWGPFSAHGSYREETNERTYTGAFSGATLRIEQPQLLAVAGTLLRRMPNPDLALAWQADANLEPATYEGASKLAEARRAAHAAQWEERQIRESASRRIEQEIEERLAEIRKKYADEDS